MTDDVYRRTVNYAQLYMATGSMTITKAIDEAVKAFLEKGINCIEYKDGRRVNIADYVRMALRTTSQRSALQGKAKRFAELGYDTVMTSQYSMCSKTCEPYQGKVFIDDVFTVWHGEVNGDYGKSNYCGKWFMLLSVAIRNGLLHPNCRHTLLQYIDGITNIPKPIDSEKLKERRKLEAKQRQLENKIRKLKRLKEGTFDPNTAKAYGKKLRQTQSELKAFIDEHKNVLKRDYSKEKFYGNAVDKTEKSGTIELRTSNGIEITRFSEHMKGRAAERKVSIDEIKEALTNPLDVGEIKVDSLGRPSQRFIGEKATVNVNPETGTIATIWKTGKSKIKKYKKE